MSFNLYLINATGIVGLAILLLAFVANLYKKLEKNPYYLLNAVGALLLTIYSILIEAYVFTVLEFVWFLASLAKLLGRRNIT